MKKQSGFRRLVALALTLCMLAALTSEIFAADIVASGYCGGEGDGKNLTWTLDSDGVLTISGKGEMANYEWDSEPWPKTRVKKVKNVSIESGVTSVGAYAFHDYTNITCITIPDSVERIGDKAFSGCLSLTDIVIPSGITSISYGTFANCRGLTSITIPNGATSIGDSAFSDCRNLTSIEIPNSVTSIGDNAFYDCHNLTSIEIPNSVISIGDKAFCGCRSLTSITLSNSMTSISRCAFEYCRSLMSIAIPGSVTSIGECAFEGCNSLTSITISSGVTSIGQNAFNHCSSLTSITIPNSVTSMGRYAFRYCSSLTSVTIPNSVTSIESGVFLNCSSLTSITIPNGVSSIGLLSFGSCSSLTNVIISDSVISIDSAFDSCSNLESAYFYGDAPATSYARGIFYKCKSTFCIYYIPGTSGWTDSSAYDAAAGTWNGYPLKTWDGKTIPEETKISVPTGKYCIRAIDESGNPVSDATVWWNGSRAVTDENGDAFVDLTTAGEPVIRVVKSRYIEWTNKNSNWKKSDTRFEQVILYPESYGKLKLKYAKISDILDTNLVIQTKVLNLRNDGALIGDLNSGYFDLSCAATDTSAVTGYAVYQNKKEIAKSTDGNFQKLDVRDFVEGGGCFVRVTGANGQTMDTRINLQFAKNSVNEDFKFELKGKKISFAVSDDIPYIGGTTLSFDMPLNAPVFVSATQDKLQFGINFVSKKLEGNSAKTEAEQLEEYKDTIAKIITYGNIA